jgi:hypothetical protein
MLRYLRKYQQFSCNRENFPPADAKVTNLREKAQKISISCKQNFRIFIRNCPRILTWKFLRNMEIFCETFILTNIVVPALLCSVQWTRNAKIKKNSFLHQKFYFQDNVKLKKRGWREVGGWGGGGLQSSPSDLSSILRQWQGTVVRSNESEDPMPKCSVKSKNLATLSFQLDHAIVQYQN